MRNILKGYHEILAISVTLSAGTGGTATYTNLPGESYTLASLPIGTEIVLDNGDYLIYYDGLPRGEIVTTPSSDYKLDSIFVDRGGTQTIVSSTPITLQDGDVIFVAFSLNTYRVILVSDNPSFGNWMNETTGAGPIDYIDVPTDYAFAAVDVQGGGQYMRHPGVMLARDPNDPFQDYVLLSANSGAMALLGITYYNAQGTPRKITTVDQFPVDFSLNNCGFEMNVGEIYDLVGNYSFDNLLSYCRQNPAMIGLTTDWGQSTHIGFCNDNGHGNYIYVCVGSVFYDYTQPRPFPISGAEFAVVRYDISADSYVYHNFDLNTMPSGFENYYQALLQVEQDGSESSLTQLYNDGPYQDKSSYGNWMASYFNS